MTAQIRAELLSLRSLRSTYVMAAGLLGLAVFMALADLSEIGKPVMDSAAELREPMVAGSGMVAAVFLAVVACVRLGGEYRYDTIGRRLLAAPVRGRLLASRLAVYAIAGAVAAAIVFGITGAITVAMVDAKHVSLELSGLDVARLLGEVMLSGALLSMIGVGVGILTRSQTAAILTLLGVFVAERLVSSLIGGVADWLPSSLMSSLLENDGAPLAPGVAALGLAALAAAVSVAAAVALRRRDVT